jgi:PAS domain S-box-containing protein
MMPSKKSSFRTVGRYRQSDSCRRSAGDLFLQDQKSSFLIPQGELELFHYMMDHIGDEVMVICSDGRVVFANQGALKKLGYSSQSLLGKYITDLFREKISIRQWQKMYFENIKKTKGSASYIVDRVGRGGKASTVDVTVVYMQYKGGEYVLSVGRDITEQLALQEKLKKSERMKAFQNFIAGTAKEIQHPLKGLLDYSDTLVEKYKDRHFEYIGYKEFKDIMQTLEAIRDQVKHCFDTTNRLLDINRRKFRFKDESCDATSVIRAVMKSLQHSFDTSGIHCRLRLAGCLPPVAIGSLEFNQVMTSILTNAIQAMPRGGEVCLRTSYRKSEGKICVECQDDGVGISEEDLPRIFEPFFTTKHAGTGKSSGLGLAVAYSIIKSCLGDIVVKSQLRRGTLVKVFLPLDKKRKSGK